MTNKVDLYLSCSLCSEMHESEVQIPDGWNMNGGIDKEGCFCPKHSLIQKEWVSNQCPGCVGSWGDCPLFEAFAYKKLDLSDHEMMTIEYGVCPRRVNGTWGVESSSVRKMDLSERGTTESGELLAQAIIDYGEEYYPK